MARLPELHWGICGTGMIASWFVSDLQLARPEAKATHIIRAIGSSSISKAQNFAQKYAPTSATSVTCHGSYAALYADPTVDIIYIATPHAFHAQNCLDAIAAGKHVLCEKPFTVTAREARTVIDAARRKGVYVMEGVWTRFFPLTQRVTSLLHTERRIGDVQRVFVDFGLDMPLDALPATSRLRDVRLGAGSLLDIGLYSITWGLIACEKPGEEAGKVTVKAIQTLTDGVDVASALLLFWTKTGQQGILTSTVQHKTDEVFARVEGSKGSLLICGPTASMPSKIVLRVKPEDAGKDMGDKKAGSTTVQEEVFQFQESSGGRGFYHEADAIAQDIVAGLKESSIMPLSETLRVMDILDEVRLQGGAKFPQDDEQ